MGRPLGRPLGRPPKDKYKNLMPEKIYSNEITKVVTEDKFLKRIKRVNMIILSTIQLCLPGTQSKSLISIFLYLNSMIIFTELRNIS